MAFINPLDLQELLVNTFAGSLTIFIFIMIIIIATLAARFKMPNIIALIMFGLFAVFLLNYSNGLFAFVIIITGIVMFYGIGKVIKN